MGQHGVEEIEDHNSSVEHAQTLKGILNFFQHAAKNILSIFHDKFLHIKFINTFT